jgi:hypothetical protein
MITYTLHASKNDMHVATSLPMDIGYGTSHCFWKAIKYTVYTHTHTHTHTVTYVCPMGNGNNYTVHYLLLCFHRWSFLELKVSLPCSQKPDILALTKCSLYFMLSCIVIDFFLNNQPDALIIQTYSVIEVLHVSGIFSTHHQEFPTVLHETYQCRMYSRKLLMMGREDARNM